MNPRPSASTAPGFWRTVGLLLSVARRRAVGRTTRQRQLLQHRTGSDTDTLGGLGLVMVWIGMAIVNSLAGNVVHSVILTGQRFEAEQQGKIVVGGYFVDAIRKLEAAKSLTEKRDAEQQLETDFIAEAQHRSDEVGGSKEDNKMFLRKAVQNHRRVDFISRQIAEAGPGQMTTTRSLPAMLGSLFLIWWLVMMIFQGEGLELDLQRRRNPMWEWLFSHPVKPGAIFLAEMLSPIAANPIYATGPFFFGFLYGSIYGGDVGIVAALLIGVPVSVAAACVGKALEIGIMLRFSPRTRGAVIGFMGWLGYAAMMSFLLAFIMPRIVGGLARLLLPLARSFPWPWFSWSVGLQPDGSFSFISGMIVCWLAAIVMIAGGVGFTVWGAQRGITSSSVKAKIPTAKKFSHTPRFGKDPLYRKEILWFLRDRGAIVQVILIPLTVAGFELFNLRWLVQGAENSWHYLSGAALMFGTYFLWVLGPRSLASEGQALWLALTWPRGLEELMKAKARLWFVIATALVMLVLGYAMMSFPDDAWKVLLVAIGWVAFGMSMSQKSVTLVSATSSSGEPDPIPKGRRWAASLGTFTFAIGVITLRWQIAVVGIVYSWVTAAAMWQNFRARLPFLFDPWSEKVPPPPTLMHAMIAISVLAEGGAILTGVFILFISSNGDVAVAIAQALAYGSTAIVISLVVSRMLTDRGLPPKEVWCWRTQSTSEQTKPWWWSGDGTRDRRFLMSLSIGAGGGLLLGLLALGYVSFLSRFPTLSEMFRVTREQMEAVPIIKLSYAVMAIAFAPFAEEYLFRGLLFRALDREWGGWRALVGSAAFFAIYHQPLAWLPVGLVGLTNALLFKKTGRLAPAVILHLIYNAVVLSR